VDDRFPYKIGYDCAGKVTAVGSAVSDFKVGDEVYTRLPEVSRGKLFTASDVRRD
jgi:NADPH:quinone reductase-like Zn-dependent oxidoreductase